MPSITTVKVVPKLVPVIVIAVLPTLGPNLGLTSVIVDVDEWEKVIALVKVISVGPLITTSHDLLTPAETGIVV